VRRALRLLPILALSTAVLSCSDMPTAPKAPKAPVIVSGVISDRDGGLLPGVYVAFRNIDIPPGQPNLPPIYSNTNAAGAFQVKLAEGHYEVLVQPPYNSGIPAATIPSLEVKGAETTFNYRFLGTRLSGNITGPGGSLLQDSQVWASSYSGNAYATSSSVNGHYSLLLPPGTYNLQVTSGYYSGGLPNLYFDATISTADTTMDFALTGNEMTVKVTLRGTAPLVAANVSAQAQGEGIYANSQTDLGGIAKLYLPSSTYTITVGPPYPSIVGPIINTVSISGDTPLSVDFSGVEWHGTLRRTADNAPLPFAWVSAREHGSSNRYASSFTDASGAFNLIVLPSVLYDFRVSYPALSTNPYVVPNVSSVADSIFDVLINAP